jgi:hypothetical protein
MKHMMTFTLHRVGFNDDGTYGVWCAPNMDPLFVTLEESNRGNKNKASCVNAGSYLVKRTITEHHGETWQLQDVDGRDAILIHVINTEKDTEGCIGLGMEFGRLMARDDQSGEEENQPAILRSGEAIQKFNEMMVGEDEFILVIMW